VVEYETRPARGSALRARPFAVPSRQRVARIPYGPYRQLQRARRRQLPPGLRATHWISAFFIGYLIRSGIQILSSYPRLYWNDHSAPGREWLTLTRDKIPADRAWTSLEQELNAPPWLGHPGGNNLGLGRIWHFFAVISWILAYQERGQCEPTCGHEGE
jgi:hypothetical protein